MTSPTHPPLAVDGSTSRMSAATPANGISGLLWLTWRQHRWTILGALIIAAVLTGRYGLSPKPATSPSTSNPTGPTRCGGCYW